MAHVVGRDRSGVRGVVLTRAPGERRSNADCERQRAPLVPSVEVTARRSAIVSFDPRPGAEAACIGSAVGAPDRGRPHTARHRRPANAHSGPVRATGGPAPTSSHPSPGRRSPKGLSATQNITQVYGIVAFRYSRLVTVAGKGGRPKKWKSDADRVRAYRARQRGEPEPPKLDQAVEQDDDVARLISRIEELERKVSGDRRVASALRSRVQQLDRENEELRRRIGQRDHELEALRELNARLSTQRDQLMAALNAWAARGEDPSAVDGAEQLPRAERRRRAREELRPRPR